RNLENITVNLLDSNGDTVATTQTLTDGSYLFEDVTPGDYVIVQENDTDFVDVTDAEGANDSQIAVTVGIGESVVAQNFVDEVPASIAGNVSQDDDNDGAGDTSLEGITVNLLDTNGDLVATTVTLANGNYLFEDVTPGDYTIEQINNANAIDVSDVEGANDSRIAVTVGIGESVTAQNFVDEQVGSIAGSVTADLTNDGVGDAGLENVVITLQDSNGDTVATTNTNNLGEYIFNDVPPGDYTVVETQPTGYGEVSETDGDLPNDGVVNNIAVSLAANEVSTGNNFVDIELGEVTGRITADVDNNDTGDSGLSNVVVNLVDSNNTIVQTTTTNSIGEYTFSDVFPGDYTVVEIQPTGFANVSEVDGGDDSDNLDSSIVNSIPVVVTPGESDTGNDFVEEQFAIVTGNVSANTSTGNRNLDGVTIQLQDSNGDIVQTTATDSNGDYIFNKVLPGNYTVVELQPATYSNVSEVDGLNDGGDDSDSGDNQIVNSIPVRVNAGETDSGNDFVEIENGSISGNVSQDENNDNTGDKNLAGITVTLDDGAGNVVTTNTDVDGNYSFEDITPGNYTIVQTNDTNFVDVTDSEGANDSQIAVVVGVSESVTAQDFVDEIPASITGNVSRDDNNDDAGDTNLEGITVILDDGAGNVLTTTTDADGNYLFEDVTPGDYTITQENAANFVDVSDVQGANDSQIAVSVGIGESVTAQNFVDEVPASIAGNVSRDDDNDGSGDRNFEDITVNLLDQNGDTVATTVT
ncbi:MAG: SdrD B-like domain-containing protein, partial [Cyanobacteria bacterium J06582_2]